MSIIDNKIVSMVFDNSKFEKNAQTSIDTLDKLQKGLKFEDSATGLEKVAAAVKNVGIDSLGSALEGVTSKFSVLETVAFGALTRLGQKALDTGERFIKSLSVDNIAAGWEKFGDKTTSVSTLVAQGYDISTVNEQLERLNWFTDETSYNFTDMVSNIAKFTASGQELETSVTALEGIANWAALSGQNANTASRAMYQISQAMGAGVMRKEDYKSIQNVSMDTDEFRQKALDAAVALGTLKKNADGTYESLVGKGGAFQKSQFAEHLTQDAWFTSDVMMEVFNDYSAAVDQIYEYAEERGITASEAIEELGDKVDVFGLKAFRSAQEARTFGDVVDSVKDAVSTGWMNTFENIFGDYETSKVLWTDLANELYDIFAGGARDRNQLLEDWVGLGGREDLFSNIEGNYGALWNLIYAFESLRDAVTGAFTDVFPPLTAQRLKDFTTSLKEATASVGEWIDNNSGKLQSVFRGLFSVFSLVKEAASAVFRSLEPVFSLIFKGAGSVLDFSAGLGDTVYGFAQWVKETDAFYNGIQKIVDVIKNAKDRVHDFVEATKEKIGLEGIENLKENFSGTITVLEKVKAVLIAVKDAVIGFLKDINFENVKSALSKVWSILSSIGSLVVRVFSSIAGYVKDFIGGFSLNELNGLGNTGVIAMAVLGMKKLVDSFGDLSDIVGGVKDFLTAKDGFLNQLKDILESYQKSIEADTIKKIAIAVAILAASLILLTTVDADRMAVTITGLASLVGVMKLVINMLSSSGGLMDVIKNSINIMAVGTALMAIAEAMVVMAAAVFILGSMDLDDLAKGIGAITILLREMTSVAKKLGTGKQDKTMMAGAKNAIMFAAAIEVLAIAVRTIASLEPMSLIRGLAGVSLLLFELTVAAERLGNDEETGKMMKGAGNAILFAAAVEMLCLAVRSLSGLDPASLVVGIAAVSLLMFELVKSAEILGNDKESSRMLKGAGNAILFAAAIDLLAIAVKVLGGMDLISLAKGLGGVTIIIAELVAASALMNGSGKGAAALALASTSLLALAIPLKIIGGMSIGAIAKGIGAIAAAFLVLGVAGAALSPLAPVIVILAEALALIGVAALSVGVGLLAASAALAAFAGSAAVVVKAIITIITDLIVAIPNILAALAVSLTRAVPSIIDMFVAMARAALDAIRQVVPEAVETVLVVIEEVLRSLATHIQPIVESLLDIIIGVIQGLANGVPKMVSAGIKLIKAVIDSIIDALGGLNLGDILVATAAVAALTVLMTGLTIMAAEGIIATASLALIARNLNKFIDTLQPFLEKIQEVNPRSLEGAKNLAEMILMITAASILDGLTSWFTGGNNIIKFGRQLSEFAPYLKQYADKVRGINPTVVQGSANAAKSLAEFATNIPNSGGVVSWFTGDNTLSKFGEQLEKFGEHFATYANEIADIKPAVVVASSVAAKSLAEMAHELPNQGGIVSWFTGDNTLGKFGEGLESFGEAFRSYYDAITKGGAIDANVVTSSANAAKSLAEMAHELPNQGGIVSWFAGDNTLGKFGDGLESFGEAFRSYYDAITNGGTIDADVVTSSANAAKALAEFANAIPDQGGLTSWIDGDNTLSKFANELTAFGEPFAQFARDVADIKADNVTGVANAALALAEMADKLPDQGGLNSLINGVSSMSDFANQLEPLGPAISKFSKSVHGVSEEDVSAAANAAKTLSEVAANLPTHGGIKQVFSGDATLTSFAHEIEAFAPAIASFSGIVGDIDEEDVTAATNAAKTLSAAAANLPMHGGIKQIFTGDNTLSAFAKELEEFGPSVKTYADSVSGITAESVQASADAAAILVELQNSLGKTGGIKQLWSGKQDLKKFGESLVAFGGYMKDYADATQGITSSSLSASTAIATSVQSLQTMFSSGGKFSDGTTLDKFGDSLSSFGSDFRSYYDSVNHISTFTLSRVVAEVEKLIDLASLMNSTSTSGMTNFGTALKKAGKSGIDEFVNAFKNSNSEVTKAVNTFFTNATTAITGKTTALSTAMKNAAQTASIGLTGSNTAFSKAGGTLMDQFIAGLSSKATSVNATTTTIGSNAASQIKQWSNYNAFYEAGKYLVGGLVNGLNDNAYKVNSAAKRMASAAAAATRAALRIRSPSKVFYEIGDYAGLGLVNALVHYRSIVYDAGYEVGDYAKNGLTAAVSQVNRMLSSDFDTSPTIRPVMDLTDIQNGADQLHRMLGDIDQQAINGSLGYANRTALNVNQALSQKRNVDDTSAANAGTRYGDTFNNTFYINGDNGEDIAEQVSIRIKQQADRREAASGRNRI